MIEREIMRCLTQLFAQYPVVTMTGPRQSGKTTLCRAALPNLAYLNLEAPDQRAFAESDPRGFLAQASDGAIIDEVQNVPELLSYIQVDVDERRRNGAFVLTGSEQFRLSRAISQSLAGRTALLRLLPFSLAERARTEASTGIDDVIFSGFYPRILDQGLDPRQALGDYFETYVERDVRRSNEIRNLASFRRFVQLCSGRIGQLVNFSSLAADTGVSHTTAREWLTILEASYIIFRLQPYHANIRKRLTKSPKLFFYDVGLASYLLGIENARQVASHPLRGALFENVVVVEALKHRLNRGRQTNLHFFRDLSGLECDLLCDTGQGMAAVEIKSGVTISRDYFTALNRVSELLPNIVSKVVVYGGTSRQKRSDCTVVPLQDFAGLLNRFDIDQEMSDFIAARTSPAPARDDVKTLDAVYSTHIRPTLDVLQPYMSQFGGSLFHNHMQSGKVSRREWGAWNPIDMLAAHRWDQAKDDYIISQGFTLSDDLDLAISARFSFREYTGKGIGTFDTVLIVEWRFGSTEVVRTALIDSTAVAELVATINYSDLETRPVDANSVLTSVVRALLDRIAELSGTQPVQ